MGGCFNCGYWYADVDELGEPLTIEYCHFEGPEGWAPCETEDIVEDDCERMY